MYTRQDPFFSGNTVFVLSKELRQIFQYYAKFAIKMIVHEFKIF